MITGKTVSNGRITCPRGSEIDHGIKGHHKSSSLIEGSSTSGLKQQCLRMNTDAVKAIYSDSEQSIRYLLPTKDSPVAYLSGLALITVKYCIEWTCVVLSNI